MGTNYYLSREPACPACGHAGGEKIHVGKSSFGWCFSLHVDPNNGICDLEDWRKLWSAEGATITNEYGDAVSREEMDSHITERRSDKPWNSRAWGQFYRNEAHFHESNGSERGPHNLLRHRIGRHCIKHGAGTWDCIVGEFS